MRTKSSIEDLFERTVIVASISLMDHTCERQIEVPMQREVTRQGGSHAGHGGAAAA